MAAARRESAASRLRQSLLFVLLGLAVFWAVGRAGDSLSPLYRDPEFTALMDRLGGPDPAYLALGNSHATAIEFTDLGVDGQRLWKPDADFFELEALFEGISSRFPGIRTVLVPVSLEFLYIDHAGTDHYTRFETYDHLYDLSYFTLLPDELLGWPKWLASFVRRPDRWRGVKRALFCREPGCAATREKGIPILEAPLLRADARSAADHILSMAGPRLGQDSALRDGLDALGRLVRTAERHGIRVILFDSPVSTIYREEMEEQLRGRGVDPHQAATSFDRWLRGTLDESPCLYYLDTIWHQGTDGREAAFYRDSIHLSAAGARLFSQRLAPVVDRLPACRGRLTVGAARD